jgi:predicted  nucleic acid-binding Zn-ribbon protein
MNMNKKLITIAILSVSALFTTATSAIAEETTPRKAAVDAWKSENKAASDTYKAAVERYKTAKQSFFAGKKSINEKFKADASATKAQTKAAVEAATTAEAKKVAKASGKSKLDALIAARGTAIAALTPAGAKPTKPVKPAKPVKPTKPVDTTNS